MCCAIAAPIARPDKQVVVIIGDGAGLARSWFGLSEPPATITLLMPTYCVWFQRDWVRAPTVTGDPPRFELTENRGQALEVADLPDGAMFPAWYDARRPENDPDYYELCMSGPAIATSTTFS